jgi:signal transduction histidine kinase
MKQGVFRKGETGARPIQNGSKDVFVCLDLAKLVVAANPSADRLFGDGGSIIGRPCSSLDLPAPVHKAIDACVAAALDGQSVTRETFEVEGLSADGQKFLTTADVLVVAGAAEKDVILVHLRDFAERLESERKVLQLSKILHTMSEGNQVMVGASDELELYAAMCRVIIRFGGYALAWVGLIEHDELQTVRPVASAGIDNGYLSLAHISWADRPGGNCPAIVAIRTATPSVCNDLMLDSQPELSQGTSPRKARLPEPWRAAALERGFRSILALPLKDKGAVFGCLTIYAREPDAFGLDETALLVELAENLAYGAIALRDHKARGELEQALARAQKMEAIGELSGGVAHDFNNLLQVVASSLHVIRQRPDDIAGRTVAIETIQHACQRAAGLTRDLLALTRNVRVAPEDVDPRIEVYRWRELIVHSVGPGVSIIFRIPPETWPVLCDPSALEIALINLAVNARDAMPQGGTFMIAARNVHAGGRDFVEFDVSDTGCGIDPGDLKHVFEPFYTTKPAGKGTGLGLSQVARFARQSEGEARIASQKGEGATVTLRIPRALAADERVGQDLANLALRG